MQETIKNILGISELLLLPWVLCLVLPVGFVLFGIKPSRRMGMICLWISLVVLVLFAIRLYAFNGASLLFPSSDTKCTRGGFYSICNINESLLAFQFSLLVFALSICAFIIYPLGVVLCWFKKLRKFGLLCLCLTMPLILLFLRDAYASVSGWRVWLEVNDLFLPHLWGYGKLDVRVLDVPFCSDAVVENIEHLRRGKYTVMLCLPDDVDDASDSRNRIGCICRLYDENNEVVQIIRSPENIMWSWHEGPFSCDVSSRGKRLISYGISDLREATRIKRISIVFFGDTIDFRNKNPQSRVVVQKSVESL